MARGDPVNNSACFQWISKLGTAKKIASGIISGGGIDPCLPLKPIWENDEDFRKLRLPSECF